MASQWANQRDSKFLLHEVLKIDQALLGKAPFSEIDPEMVDMVVDAAARFGENRLAPHYPDEARGKPIEAVFKDNVVRAPEAYKELWKRFTEGGWLSMDQFSGPFMTQLLDLEGNVVATVNGTVSGRRIEVELSD